MKYMLFIIVVGSILLNGCEKDLDTYEGGCGIYFNNNEMLSDTVGVAWGMLPGTQKTQTLTLQVDLYGTVAPYDRSFSIEVVSAEDDTLRAEEGVDYDAFPLEYVIPANEASTEINVPLLRRENLSEKPRRFTIKLIENEELRFLYSRQMMVDSVTYRPLDFQRVIVMTEDFPQPGWWSREGQSRFGDFSQKKASLICDVMGIDRETWLGPVGFDNFTQGYLSYVGKAMHQYLQAQDPPILDEDDDPMEMGPDSIN